MRAWDIDVKIDFSDVSLEEKLCKENNENILIHEISCKSSTDAKPLRIRYDKINGFIKIHNKIRYLVLFDWCDKVYDRIKHLISETVVLQIVLIIILQESELIHMILYQLKK